MRKTARVVIIGGGNMGASVLYHLAKEGWSDVLLIEKAELTSGATWHAAGLVSRMTPGHALGICHDYAVDLYKNIEAETEQSVSWHNCGSLRVGATEEHREWLMHTRDAIIARGQECHWVSSDEVADLNPLYDTTRILGGIYTPDDGHVDPYGTCQAMAKGATQLGATIIRRNRVLDISQASNGEWLVETEQGAVSCEHVVNAGGYHAKQIGEFVGLNLPITSLQHHYAVTDTVPEFLDMDHEIPVTRDDYFTGYLRREQDGALIGLYDTHDALVRWQNGCPWESENELFEPDYDRITPWLGNCFERFPSLSNLGLKRIVNGAITYTPDGSPLVGPAIGLRNFWLACGATVGIAWGPGMGKALAQWIVHGSAEISTRGFDPRRFGGFVDDSYTIDRSRENYMTRLSLHFPQDQYHTHRNIQVSGAHQHTGALNAAYEEVCGWERPRVYGEAEWNHLEPKAWRRGPSWAAAVNEAQGVYQSVGLGDFSAFSKFRISGAGAEAFLNELCTNSMPKKVGGTCLTLLLNGMGTIEAEATIARLSAESFWFVTGAPSENRVWDWIVRHKETWGANVQLENLTRDIGIITIAGPKAREVLQPLTDTPLEPAEFPWLSAKEIEVAGIDTIALRLSFTGELAWELHAANDQLGKLWHVLWQAGEPHNIVAFGSKALDMLRLEKAYRGGHELVNDVSPIEVDQMRFVKLDKEFIGRDALLDRQSKPSKSRIVYLEIEADDSDALGGEALYHQGELVGSISSANYGPISNKSLAFGFVRPEFTEPDTDLEVSIFGEMIPVKVLAQPVRDPYNLRLKQ